MNKLTAQLRSLLRPLTRRPRNTLPFEELFNRFREVLGRNNRSLEIITEMGDTLGGDYLFDVQYLKHSSDRLSRAVNDSLAGFDMLTQNRYPKLHDAFITIDGQLRRVIDDTTPVSQAFVVSYENIVGDMVKAVGGKNSNLAEIKNKLAIAVPDAFAVTTRSFEAFLQYNRIFEKSSFPPGGVPVSGAAIREAHELILHGTVPPELSREIDKAVKKLRSRCGGACGLAVRSSAGEEDGDFSFAGLFETVLNVPLETPAIEKAYRKVIASLFSEKAAHYQTRLGYELRDMKMAVACVVMVDAVASGVLYSSDPQGDRSAVIINAAWGLGTSIVEGQTDADYFRVKKDVPGELTETRIGAKDSMITTLKQGGVAAIATPEGKKGRSSLSPEQAADLARLGLLLEKHYKRPQDIEWAIDNQGKIFILQSRPLKLPGDMARRTAPVATAQHAQIVLKHHGFVVQKGAAAGPVFIVRNEQDIDSVPRGAILVARHDSSSFVRVMTEVAAIITDIGTPTSHMAALCREFRLPTIVNTGNATQMLAQGQELTVRVESEGATLYQGVVRELVEQGELDAAEMEALAEFRKKRFLLRYISPLNLVDPLRDEFTPQACKTMHDILRFIHEKSVAELIENAEKLKNGAIKLDLPVPAGILVMDLGGGLRKGDRPGRAAFEQIESLPFKAIVKGMIHPGAWRSEAVALTAQDFLSSMMRMPDIASATASTAGYNIAVVSREYVNMSIRFGYHFNMIDCYMTGNARNNHIYFRFAGGATDLVKRTRRLELIAKIMKEFGFNIKIKGDLLIARLAGLDQADMEQVLDQTGRLIAYARQLDAALHDDQAVDRHARDFLAGVYELR